LREAWRVARRWVVILEDTPRTWLDRLAGWMHGRLHRRQIGSTGDLGFYTQREWERLCPAHGLSIGRSTRVPRFERLWWRPWARSAFVLEKVAEVEEHAGAGDRRACPAAERAATAASLRVAEGE
jgi:hypothetical protein